uniref:Odorant receptor n=1 Tax=Mayetiola destructor TaxID=39758 RepID=A0A1D8GZF9_MAYDE|nr:odorant receptor 120 [Mayetiola destructor]
MDFIKKPRQIWSDVKKVQKLYNNWDALTPAKQMHCVHEVGRLTGIIIGVRAMHDCRIVASSFMMAIVLVLYYISAVYTIYIRTIDGQFAEGLQCLSISGIYSSAMLGYLCLVLFKERFTLHKLTNFSQLNVYMDDPAPTKFNKVCKGAIKQSVQRIKLILFLTYVSIIVGSAYPAYVFFKTGKLYTLTGVLIPGVSENSATEMYLNAIYLFVTSIIAGISLLFIHCIIGILCDNIVVTSNIIVLEIEQLSDNLERNDLKPIEIRLRVKRIILQILKSDECTAETTDALYWFFFLSPYVLTYAIGLAMYSQYLMGFPCGYGIAGMSYVQLFVLCVVGQNTVDSKEKIRIALGNFKWYLIPDMEVRRDIGFILQQVQNCSVFTMGPFDVLNYEFGGILTQRILSFMMLLINFGK